MKSFLHKITKVFIILLLIMLVITLGVIGWLYFSNQSKLKEEASLITTPPGQMVEVDGTKLHVYVTGKENAKDTIVFLHGTAMTDASIAMQPLFDELSENYRIVYVDRAGNGYSEAGDSDKSTDKIVETIRSAIKEAGIEGEIVLFSQTTSGIAACYWAKTYPEEVKGVIGLDMSYPEEYAGYYNEEGSFKYMMYIFSKIGIMRHVDAAYPKDTYNLYSDKQIIIRNALISKNSYTKDMYEEDKMIGDNARAVNELGFPEDVPMLMLFSNPIKEPYLSTDASAKADLAEMKETYPEYDFETEYNKGRIEYFKQYSLVTCIEISGPSALYTYAPDEMAQQIDEYMNKIEK